MALSLSLARSLINSMRTFLLFSQPETKHHNIILFFSQLIKNNLRDSNYVNSFVCVCVCAMNTLSFLFNDRVHCGLAALSAMQTYAPQIIAIAIITLVS